LYSFEFVTVIKRTHVAILRGKLGGVNFRLCSRRRFTLTRQVASTRQAAFTSFRRDQRATTVHFHGSTTLQPKRSNGVVSRVTIRTKFTAGLV
jgi:hypothetical protein